MATVAKCSSLEHLLLIGLHINDSMISHLCEMLVALDKVEHLYIAANEITTYGFNALSKCLKNRERKLHFLEIRDNSGVPLEDTIRRLKMFSHYVMHD